jgi:pyruvate/2-oxoacid:ferredoxin oxidoreductase beta subunit
MNISLTFNVDGTEEEVFGAINSYGVAIQHMSPIIANKNTNKKKVTSTKKEKVEDGDIVIEVPKPEPKEEAKKVEEAVNEWEEKMQEPKEEPKKEEPKKEEPATVKLDDIQKLGVSLLKDHQKEVQQIIRDFGIKSLAELPADKYEAVYEALNKIGG